MAGRTSPTISSRTEVTLPSKSERYSVGYSASIARISAELSCDAVSVVTPGRSRPTAFR